MTPHQLFFAIHDVTPFHLNRLKRAEELFQQWGVEKILYLLIPNYHGAHRADRDAAFRAWCHRQRPFQVEWCQHGYFHVVSEHAASVQRIEFHHGPVGAGGHPVGSTLSDEGEFRHLTPEWVRDRLVKGREVFRRTLDREPSGFIAPKWQGTRQLVEILTELGYTWTEDDHSLYNLASNRRRWSPVVTWVTRSLWRKQLGLLGCPLLERLTRSMPLLRIAMHPFDFDHPDVIRSIARIIERARRDREQAFYPELLAADQTVRAA
jgi:predicted deacetylase